MPSEVRFAKFRKYLEEHGYTLQRISGSHHFFTKPGSPSLVIPVHNKRVAPYYVADAKKQIEGRG